MKKIEMLESRVEILESDVAIIKQSNKLLERKTDDNEQYSRRMCLRINGIPIFFLCSTVQGQSHPRQSHRNLDLLPGLD